MKTDLIKNNRSFILYLVKFGLYFCLLYFGALFMIGVTVPGGIYSEFVANHLNIIDWLRSSLLLTSAEVLSWFGYNTHLSGKYNLVMTGGHGVRMVYSCIGYGVMSFWGAFVLANKGYWLKKLTWILAGWLGIWLINVFRITILIIAVNKQWKMPLGWEHHTWFNIAAYMLIFLLIYLYDRSFTPILENKN